MDPMLQSTMSVKRRKGESEMKCKACNREAGESDYCESHMKAYGNIV